MLKAILAGATVLGGLSLGAITGHATIVSGTGTFADNGPTGNGLIFSGVSNNAALTNLNLKVGKAVTLSDFLTITSDDANDAIFGQADATDTISEAFAFTLPTAGGVTVNGSGQETTDAFFGFIDGASGSITWNNPGTVDFTDGSVLQISLSTASFDVTNYFVDPDQTVTVDATLTLIHGPNAVPEPGAFALLGSGFVSCFGFTAFGRRRA